MCVAARVVQFVCCSAARVGSAAGQPNSNLHTEKIPERYMRVFIYVYKYIHIHMCKYRYISTYMLV